MRIESAKPKAPTRGCTGLTNHRCASDKMAPAKSAFELVRNCATREELHQPAIALT